MMVILKRLDRGLGGALEEGARLGLMLFFAVAAGVALLHQALAIAHRYPLDYGEAPLVDQAMRLAAGQNIYRADIATPPYTIANYPPLYVASLVPALMLFGPSFAAGRAISTLCAWLAAIFIALIIHGLTRDRLAAAVGGLTFMAFPYVVGWSSLLRIDLLALALSLAGLYLLAPRPISRNRLATAAMLLVAAIYTRQSYALAAPLAAFVWVWSQDRRSAVWLAAFMVGSALTLFVLLNILTGGAFYFNIVTANVNEFGLDRLAWNLRRIRDAAPILIVVGLVSLMLIRRWNSGWPLAAPYLVGSVLSALTIGKIGSNVNYFLELCAGLSLGAGLVVAWTRRSVYIHSLRAALLILLAFQTGRLLQRTFDEAVAPLTQRRAVTGELGQLEGLVAEAEGPILADEYMGMLTLQGRPLIMQPFEVTQLARAGLWDQGRLVQSIADKEYSLILIHYFPGSPVYKERWTVEMLSAVQRAYVATEFLADTGVYRPIGYKAPIGEACPGAPWRLPTRGELGVEWKDGGLTLYGRGKEAEVPVYAVADGQLVRLPEWVDTLAIQHDDPLRLGEKVWSYYAGMGGANGVSSTIVPDFPPGTTGVPVKAGTLLGYQGSWSGRAGWPMWVHLHFSVVPAAASDMPSDVPPPGPPVDPVPYLKLEIEAPAENPNSQTLACQGG